jgi:hypothetical protein
MDEYEGDEPYCPYCKKSLSWDQWKELWVCREHGKFDDSQVIHGNEEPKRVLYKFTYEFSCEDGEDPLETLEQEIYDIIHNDDKFSKYGDIEKIK